MMFKTKHFESHRSGILFRYTSTASFAFCGFLQQFGTAFNVESLFVGLTRGFDYRVIRQPGLPCLQKFLQT